MNTQGTQTAAKPAQTHAGSGTTLLVLEVSAAWDSSRRAQAVSSLLAPLARIGEASRKLDETVAELLGNAVRHSTGGTVRLALCIDSEAGDFRVQTDNQADRPHAERLATRLALLAGRGAREAYRGLLVDSTEHGLMVGLGLARLAAQNGIHLASRVVDDRLQVVAASRVPSFLPALSLHGTERGCPQIYLAHPGTDAVADCDDWGAYVRLLAEAMLPGSEPDSIDSHPWERLQVEQVGEGIRVRGSWVRGEA